jgi:phosphoribosyl-ATP pyrophosphohydrolase/phosphoribosyl-AMP cyclohydrolase
MVSVTDKEGLTFSDFTGQFTEGGMPDFSRPGGLVPAVVQHAETLAVLMLGYMNHEAFVATQKTKRVTFFSRSRQELWQKGEASGNVLELVDLLVDCDSDAILVKAIPKGPTCHTGTDSCFQKSSVGSLIVLERLSTTLRTRREQPNSGSYTSGLFAEGIDRVAQKVGEEAIEVVIEAKNAGNARLLDEAADLLFHLMALLTFRDVSLEQVCKVLEAREMGREREVPAREQSC